MARYNIDEIINNANSQKKKKKRYDIDEILNNANNISKSSSITKTNISTPNIRLNNEDKNFWGNVGNMSNKMLQEAIKVEEQRNFAKELLKNSISNVKNINLGDGFVKASSAFDDGYQFGDVSKTILSTTGDVALNVGKGIMNIGEGIGDLATYGIAGIADLTGNDEYADKLRYNASNMNVVDDLTKPVSDFVDKNSVLGDKADEIAQGLGYVAGNTAMSILTGGLGAKLGISSKIAQTAGSMGTTFSSSMGHGMSEAYQNGATDDEAFAYGIISAAGETGSELMFGGLGKASKAVGLSKGAGELDDIVIGGLTKNIKNKMAKTLVQSGLKAGGEGAEEVVSGLISAVGKKLTYMSEEELGQILKDENLAEQFWMGALTSAIAQSPSTISSIKNRTDYITGEKYNDIQKNNAPELAQNHQNNERQQTILNDIKMPQNQNKPQLDDMLNNKELPMQKYVYEKSNNIKINNLRQDANKYFNNSEKAHNYMQMLEKIIEDKNIDIRLDANLKTPDGRTANGSYSNGVMTINPNSAKAGEFIAVHELTHAIGTKDMLNIVENYRKNNKEFNSEVERLLQNYNSTEITEEALSDVSAQLFGNQEFINNISQNNPNIFQKIYSEIKYLWHQFRGYKNQDQFVEDLYYKWTQAYNSNNKLNNTTSYHISKNLSNDIDNVLKNINERNPVRLRDYTPSVLVNNGIKNLPMYENPAHIRKNILTESEARKAGLSINTRDHYHGLGKEVYIKAIDSLDKPRVIFKNNTNNEYLILTVIKDKNNNNVIVPIEIETNTKVNNVTIDINRVKTVYGYKEQNNIDLNDYIKHNIKKNKFAKIYEQKKEKGTGFSTVANSNTSIPSSSKDVNTTTKYSIQENENNSKWQQYLDKNFKSTGTRTNLEDVRQIAPYKNDKNVSDSKAKIAPTKVEEKNKKKEFNDKVYFPQNFAEVTEELNNNSNAELLEQLYNDRMTLKEQKDFLTQKFVNKGHYIDQLAKKTGDKELTYKYDRMLGAQSEGQYEIGVAQTDNYGNKIGKSINEIWKPVEENKMVTEFSDYLLNKHNIDRMKAGKPIFGEEFTSAMSEKVVENYEKLYPEFKNWSKDVNTFYKNQLKNTREAGLTSAELEETLNDMYENYIIVSRAKDSDYIAPKGKTTGVNSPIKRARGGNADIQPLKDAMAKQAIAIKQAIRRNDVGLELLNVLKSVEDVNDYDVNNIVSQDKKGAYFIVFKEGKAKKIKITEGLYESLKNSQKYKIEQTMPLRAIRKFSNIQRSLLTVDNPIFMVTNFFKDFQDGMFNSKYTSKFIKNYGKAIVEIKRQGKYYNEYMANGGNSNTYFDYEKGVKKKTKIGKFIDKIRTGNEIIEMAPRLSEYISTREAGGSVNEALYNAAEITTNFKRGGDVAKALNRNGANFLNASIQGLSKQIRNLSGQNGIKGYTNLLVKATLLGVAPSMLNHLLLGDDDEYEKLPDYVKDTYYLFKIGDDKFLRIPKGRVLSIFGSAARRTLEYSEGNEEAFKGFGDTAINQMAPNNPLSDNILAPIVQASKNETWYGGDLVPTRLQDELPENQYDESTDSFSKWLGKITGISPMKINYVLDQYSGGVGDILLPMMTPQAENNVLTDKFTIDSTLKNKNVSKFYETIEEQTRISNAPEATDEDILKTKYLSSIQSSVSDLYKEKREIQLSDLTDKVKKEEVKRIQKEINDILETGLEEYDKGDIQSNYATIGDVEYYKNKDNEWTKLTDEEKDKNKNIPLETYADYKQKTYEKKVKLVENGEIKDTQSLKSKDKIQILLDSNYSNKEIKAIYENYIKSENDSEYTIINKTGINIKEYLKYKQQDFSSDSVDDGTTKGKTVSGSSKVKTYEYVNKMNITYEQRLMLLGMKYTLTDTEQTKLYNYVKSLNCTTEEIQDILEKLKGFTVYKNGRVTW